ncbi:MAG: phage portal protein [Chelatococcus sp.]|uniref:phage portal protein n=1 Tax=Chelatococcus sp. TaxID=1953771 RepID=UPI0025C02D56|nr:phage portal protein [Chelatococcus sp.]MBX3536445.1 phage portal protein [Chelatococcus sp.]
MMWPFSRSNAAPAPVAAEQRADSIENPTIPVSAENFLAFFGQSTANLPAVTTESALRVPAVLAAVAFLSRTLAYLPLHAYRDTGKGAVKAGGKLQTIVRDAPNPQMGSFKFRQYFWQQVFTGGRGLAWIERSSTSVENIWPINPKTATVKRVGLRLTYRVDGRDYPAEDIIDIPFMLRENQTGHYGPIQMAAKAIQLALAMNDYGSQFFAGGGVPPLALTGPLPQGNEGLKRAMADINRAIESAKQSSKPLFPLPPGHDLKPVGFDPEKGQMTDARRFQIEEFARVWQLPPVFLQDLTRATFTNAEQQDLHLVKHLIGHWAGALEDEMNLKLFGRGRGTRYVRHNLDGVMRGDFKTRIEAIARAIQTAQMTPNEARALEERPNHENPAADELLVQGATVVLGQQPERGIGDNGGPPLDDNGDENAAED